MSNVIGFEQLEQQLNEENSVVGAAELHGLLTGILASASPANQDDWIVLVQDLAYEGESFSVAMKSTLKSLKTSICHALADPDLGFQLLLPNDDDPLADRLFALTQWVQAFLAGFGVNQQNLANASDDLREALEDMAEIARLSDEVEPNEEGERAFYEVSEYVRISAIMCYNELGRMQSPPPTPGNTTLH